MSADGNADKMEDGDLGEETPGPISNSEMDQEMSSGADAARVELEDDLDCEDHDEDDDDDDEDDEDDDEEEDEMDDEDIRLIKKYMQVLERVSQNKYNYDDYVLLVNTAHELSDLDKIRQSCELFASVYPLAPEIWLRWLRIELNIATTESEYEKVHQLFRRSLSDYYSTTVALEYANLAVKTPKSHETWEVLTSTYTLHCMEGRALFDAWRQHCAKSEPEGTAKYAKLVQMYEQELCLPLHNMEETYIEFKVLCEREKDKYTVDWAKLDDQYAAAKEQLRQCMPFEQRLLALQPHEHQQRAIVYAEYIEAGKSLLNDRIVQVLHERMVTECCLNANCWLAYIQYIQRRNGARTATNNAEQLSLVFSQTDWDVCNRALRNCTWSAELHVEKLCIAERMEMARDEVKSVAEQALAAGFPSPDSVVSVWLAYLAYLRRTTDFKDERDCELLRATFALAWDSLGRMFGERADTGCEVLQLWGRLEYGPLNDLSKGKELWTTVMQSGANAYRSGMWMEFVHLELRKGVDGARKIFRKALAITDMDDIDVIASAWIRFERCNGTLDQLKFAQRHCEQQQKNVLNTYGKVHREQRTNGSGSGAGAANPKRDLKRKVSHHSSDRSDKRMKTGDSHARTVHGRGHGKEFGAGRDVMGPPAAKPEKEPVAAEVDGGGEHHIDTTNDDAMIFLSNLAYTTTEEDITSAFPELHIENVNIIKSANGNSRGFSYVKLASSTQVEQSLAFDRRLINGRPTFISSVLRDKEQRKKFKYSAEMEPTKLFVKGLSFESTKEELQEAFGVFGSVKDVRLVLQKNGKPKGLAYIEYDSEKSASMAIMKMDQTEIRGFKINVALSAPPPKPQPNTGAVSAAATLGHGRRAQTSRGDVKPRLSFIPRVVQKLANQEPPKEAPAATTTSAPKSNADFRRFLTQSK